MRGSTSKTIRDLCDRALSSKAVKHPYLERLSQGDFPNVDMAWRDFAFQYGVYSSQFVKYLSAVIGQLNSEDHRKILQSNLLEEQGHAHDVELPADVLASIDGVPHTLLFRRFQQAVGVDRQTMSISETAKRWSDQFLKLCHSSEQAGVGAIGIGTEFIVSAIYRQILDGLKQNPRITLQDRVFFDLHSECDESHAAELIEITEAMLSGTEAIQRVEHEVLTALDLRAQFWDDMLSRAEAMPADATYQHNDEVLLLG